MLKNTQMVTLLMLHVCTHGFVCVYLFVSHKIQNMHEQITYNKSQSIILQIFTHIIFSY